MGENMKKILISLLCASMTYCLYSCDSSVSSTAKDKVTDVKNEAKTKVEEKVDKNLLNAGTKIIDSEISKNFLDSCNKIVPAELKDNAKEVCSCSYQKGISKFDSLDSFINAKPEKLDEVMPGLFKECGVPALAGATGYAFLEVCKTGLPEAVKDKAIQACSCVFDSVKQAHPDAAYVDKIIKDKDTSLITDTIKTCSTQLLQVVPSSAPTAAPNPSPSASTSK
jgi:hypothetical protein